ncbi:MAG: histidine kinase [Pseudaminobacter sp.]|nr:histidine kinase [Pseudaminobacter sp.]
MPTLIRFFVTLGILAGLVYGAMFALVMYVEPKKGEMTIRIPAEKLNPKQPPAQ